MTLGLVLIAWWFRRGPSVPTWFTHYSTPWQHSIHGFRIFVAFCSARDFFCTTVSPRQGKCFSMCLFPWLSPRHSWTISVMRWNPLQSAIHPSIYFASYLPHRRRMISRNGDSVRLHCTIPTWCPASDICKTFWPKIDILLSHIDDDLHDLHDFRTRFLVFIHSLLESLRASGVSLAALLYELLYRRMV